MPRFTKSGIKICFILVALFFVAPVVLRAQEQKPALPSVDSDPVRSPDPETAQPEEEIHRQGKGFVLQTEVEEVVLNITVLEGKQVVQNLKGDEFRIFEDGVEQKILSFQHVDVPVSIGIVVDNSGSMMRKRPAVNKSALDLILASNPEDEAFIVNFADEAFIDQDFTSDVNKLKDGLGHIESHGGTALYDAVVASADKLAMDAKRGKQVIIIITDGEDNASEVNLELAIGRVQQLSGPVIYSIGLLFGDEMSHTEMRHARRALELLSAETGGVAYFPKSMEEVDQIAAEVARDIRSQYTIGYHSTKPSNVPGFRKINVEAQNASGGKLTVRTRTGYFPGPANKKKTTTHNNEPEKR
jgi:VWFA-related protein